MTLVSALEGYRAWAPTYDAGPNPVVALESRVLSEMLGELSGKRCVDVACGTGRWANYTQDRGAKVIGIDLCREMLERCRAPVAQADAGRLPLADQISDVTICALAFGYLRSPMEELTRITRTGGSIFVSDMHPRALDRGWTHSFRSGSEVYEIGNRRYSLPDLLATAGLRLLDLNEPHFDEPERAIFRAAGKESTFEQMAEVPAIYVAHWIRL